MRSIWTGKVERPSFKALDGDKKTDVLIIGGGMAGLLCAYMLKREGVDCILCEADRICGGITENTTAKLTFQHGLIYDKLIGKFGHERAKTYLNAQRAALEEYRALCENIDCDYEVSSSFVYSLEDALIIEREVEALMALGCKSELVKDTELPFKVAGAVKIEAQAQFHPLKFAFEVSRGLPIYENTKVLELRDGRAVTNHGTVSAENIIVCTHFPFINKHGSYFLKLYQHRSYVMALEGAQTVKGMYVDADNKGLSFRSYNGTLLLGGGGHRTGKRGGGWQELSDFAARHYKDSRIVAKWATQDCMSLDSVPYIGRYSKRTQNLYVATGFNKWGMTSSMVSAMILSDMLCGRENSFAEVFSPSRSILRGQLALNAFESAVGLLTPTAPRCPHLGCALKYNAQEHSWDCPCHGSRFGEDGELINNPATDDTSFK